MAGTQSSYEELAKTAAERIEAARAAGEQLTFLPDEGDGAGAGRATRGRGKATSVLREWLANRGMRMPEDALTEMAGLATSEDAFIAAMQRTEQVLAWAERGAEGHKDAPKTASLSVRLSTFQFVFTAQLRALEAMMAYGLAKPGADATPKAPVQIIMPGAQVAGRGPNQARDVTPQPRRMAPPPMPHEIQGNQHVADMAPRKSES